MENNKYLLAAGLFYGLSLYCYAVIWPIVPIVLLLQIAYGLYHRKLHFNRWSFLSVAILFVIALPLLLFVMINSTDLPEITLPFMTIPKTSGYRGGEIATSLSSIIDNAKNALRLFMHQTTGTPYDVLLPWGLFYDIGRLFITVGILCLLFKLLRKLVKKEFAPEFYIFASLVGGGITCLMVYVKLHHANNVFIPLVLCEAYGIYELLHFLKAKKKQLCYVASGVIVAIYLFCLAGFQRDYYTHYKDLVSAYFAIGMEECVDFALAQCEEKGLSTITAEKGAQWPRLLLFTETLPSDYYAAVEYDVFPAPAAFVTKDGIRVNTRINYETISQESIYIIYYTDKEVFETDFNLTAFYDWYVAVPKG